MKTTGRHLLVELYGCDPVRLGEAGVVRTGLLEAAARIGAVVVAEALTSFHPQGVTGVVLIAESHLSIHTWPEGGYAAVDFFTCGDLDPTPGLAVLQQAFAAQGARALEVRRGLPGELGPSFRSGTGIVSILDLARSSGVFVPVPPAE